MIRRQLSPSVRAMLAYRCLKCGMGPGVWCVSRSGLHASMLHAARYRVARQRGDLPVPGVGVTTRPACWAMPTRWCVSTGPGGCVQGHCERGLG